MARDRIPTHYQIVERQRRELRRRELARTAALALAVIAAVAVPLILFGVLIAVIDAIHTV